MRRTQEARRLKTHLNTKNVALRRSEIEGMEDGLSQLEAAVASFPFADLDVTISYTARSDEYYIKTSLKLPGRVVFTGEHDSVAMPAYERCIRKLVRKVEDYKEQIRLAHRAGPNFNTGRRRDRNPATLPSFKRLQEAHQDQDYPTFRQELAGFEEAIRRRVGRWIQRYPDLDERFGESLPMDDLVEEVLLTAFERFEARPTAMRLGDWLEGLIAPAMRSFLRHPEEDLEAISYARTLQEMRGGHLPVVSGEAEGDVATDPRHGTGPRTGRGPEGVPVHKPR